MKTRLTGLVLLLLGLSTTHAQVPSLVNYQGKLLDGTNLVNASVGLTLRLYDDPAAGSLLYEDSNTVAVVDGLYSTFLGDNTISGTLTGALASAAVYVEVEVNGVVLSPRERLAAAGYAVDAAEVPGNVFWRTAGNTGTSEDDHFVGTRDNEALNFRVNNQQALRLIPTANTPLIMGGHSNNDVNLSNEGTVIAGGGSRSEPNSIRALSWYSAIGGGSGNTMGDGSLFTDRSVICGGHSNRAIGQGVTVGGGAQNTARGVNATVGGGSENTAHGSYSAVAGGHRNVASNSQAFVAGGYNNRASGEASFAAGDGARALHDGAFVWSDHSSTVAQSSDSNQFIIRASNGVGINTNGPFTDGLTVGGGIRATEAVHAESFVGDGSGLTMVNGSNLIAGTVSNAALTEGAVTGDKIRDGTISNADVAANTFWSTTGNAGTVPGTHFLGTTDGEPLELRVNSRRVVYVSTSAIPIFVAGATNNQANEDASGSAIGGGQGNRVTMQYGTVGGGAFNTCGARSGVIAGGDSNRVSANFSVIGGGSNNSSVAQFGVIAGGERVRVHKAWSAGLGGMDNTISGQYSVVVGGRANLTTGDYSFVGGGTDNRALGPDAFVGGGSNNWAQSTAAVIAGGRGNRTFMPGAAIGGGIENSVSATNGVVAGGYDNTVSSLSPHGAIVGGLRNDTDDELTFVGGGVDNAADGYGAVVGGGSNNIASEDFSIVGGGQLNSAAGFASTVAGGRSNRLADLAHYGFIGGGVGNYIGSAMYCGIGGGYYNEICYNSHFSVIAGGAGNLITTNAVIGSVGSAIGGGEDNVVSGRWAVIAGGYKNFAGADHAAIGGGATNVAAGMYSVVPGGAMNTATGRYSFAAGYHASANHDGSFVWADSQAADFTSTTNDEFAIRASNGVWVASDLGTSRALPEKGTRFGDNNIVAWGFFSAVGGVYNSFNIASISNTAEGTYRVNLNPGLTSQAMAPLAIAEMENVPTNAAMARLVSVNSSVATTSIWVYISNGSFAATNSDFVLMVTGR